MRIGVSLPDPSGPDAQGRPALGQVRDALRRAADDGFPSAWMNNIFGLDALTALAVAGSQVPGIELGTAVVPTYPRHPAALAQQALTVAAATDGRLTLGVGTSHEIVIRDMFGYDFSKPVEHTREYLSILRPLLHGEPAKVHGNQLSADITLAIPAPTPVPLLIAALGPRMLRLAAEYADGTVLWMTGPGHGAVAHRADHHRRGAGGGPAQPAGGVHPAHLRDQRPGRGPGRARPRSSPSTASCRPTGPCWTGRERPARPTWRSSGTRRPSRPSSPTWPMPG